MVVTVTDVNERPAAVDDEAETPEDRMVTVDVLANDADHLPITFREVVKLRDIEERSNAEVSEQLHISKRNVAVRLHRAHRLLRARLLQHLQ